MRRHKKIYGVLLLILALLVMQIPVSEADAAASASDFQMDGDTLVKYRGTSETVTIPSTVKAIGKSAFEGNTTVRKVTIPDSVEEIGEYAFWGCSQLESIKLGSGLTEIGDYSFANCKGLKTMTIPENITRIGIQAFADCVNMTDITIPPETTQIHETSFDGCAKLSIHAPNGSAADKYAQSFVERQAEMPEYEDVEDYNSPDVAEGGSGVSGGSVNEETDSGNGGDGTDSGGTGGGDSGPAPVSSGTLIGSTQVVGNRAVVFIDNSGPLPNQENQGENVNTIRGASSSGDGQAGSSALGEEQAYLPPVTIEKGGALPKYTVVDRMVVADQAYYRDKELTSVNLPSTITRIGQFSFARSALEQVVLPEGVQSIDYGAYYHCDALSSVSLPESVMRVEPKAFTYTAWVDQFLSSGTGGTGDYLVSGGVLVAYRGNAEKPVLPEGIRVIASEVFKGHGEIRSVTLPDSLSVIGEGAFENCENLTQVLGGSYVTAILDRAFAGCPVDTIRIVDTVEQIGLKAFSYGTSQKEDMTKAVVFHGMSLPQVSVEASAKRLSNDEYRRPALDGVLFAVVDRQVTEEMLENTVLHSTVEPFQGIICSIGEDNRLHCRYTNLSEEEYSLLAVPEKAFIYGTYYEVTDRDKVVFLEQDMVQPQPGQVQIMGTVGGVSAVLEGAVSGYVLRMEEAAETQAMEHAYQRIYHDALPSGTLVYELTLTEGNGQAPVAKLGRQNMTITMPVPETLQNQDIQVLTLDHNGQLERVSCEVVSDAEVPVIRFTTNHFSQYAFYGKGTLYVEAQVTDGQATVSAYGRKDDSPDTGDPIHPKWFLGIGLMAAAFALLLSGNGKRRAKTM